MSRETTVLLSNITDDSQPSTWQYGEKHIGAGYYKNGNGVHTMTFELNNFKGSIKVQATLDLNPGINDWVDVVLDSSDTVLTAIDSTPAYFQRCLHIHRQICVHPHSISARAGHNHRNPI
jgi:hypothetical protein